MSDMDVRIESLGMLYHDAGRPIRIFDNLSFDVPSGSSLAVVGESGVGKTTLLYLLGGLERPTSGDVRLGGLSLVKLQEDPNSLARLRSASIGFVFQFHQLLPEFDARENVALPLLIRGMAKTDALRAADELLARVGLADRLTHRPGMLSGGEQQRVAIARAFIGSPGLILADEPTGNLDLRTARSVQDVLLELQKERGITLVVVTHSLDLARRLDRIVELTSTGLRDHIPLEDAR